MTRPATSEIVCEIVAAVGLGMMGTGLWWWWPPLALIIVGTILFGLGIYGEAR